MSEFHELRFVVFVPKGGGDIREYHISASPDERGGKFKERVSKACNVPADDLDLFWNNAGQRDGNKSWLDEEKTLAEQGMEDGAEVMVGIHGLQECGAVPSDDEETAEGERSAVDDSIRRMGAASYYRWAAGKKENLAPEHRIATGGAPPVITTIEDPAPLEECERRVVSLKNYSWGDEKEVIKIYLSADQEPLAVEAATKGEVKSSFEARGFELKIIGDDRDYVLSIDNLYYDIVPEESKHRVSANKRVTITLKKQLATMWLFLVKQNK